MGYVLLGAVEDKIYKFTYGYPTLDESQANEMFMRTFTYYKSKFGKPSKQKIGSCTWGTNDGNVVLQLVLTPEEFLVLLLLTSENVKNFKKLE